MAKVIHLHWAWKQNNPNKFLDGLRHGIGVCGVTEQPIGSLSTDMKQVTCEACLAASQRKPNPKTELDTKSDAAKVPALRGTNAKAKKQYPDNAVIVMAIKHNIRKSGSAKHGRFQVLLNHNGKTVGEYIKAGGNPETLYNAVKDALAEVQE